MAWNIYLVVYEENTASHCCVHCSDFGGSWLCYQTLKSKSTHFSPNGCCASINTSTFAWQLATTVNQSLTPFAKIAQPGYVKRWLVWCHIRTDIQYRVLYCCNIIQGNIILDFDFCVKPLGWAICNRYLKITLKLIVTYHLLLNYDSITSTINTEHVISKIIDHALYLAQYDDDVVTKPLAQITLYIYLNWNQWGITIKAKYIVLVS